MLDKEGRGEITQRDVTQEPRKGPEEGPLPEVLRLVDEEGGQLGILSSEDALLIAQEKGLDLVVVSPKAEPPVYRLMDYGKYKYLQRKKQQESKRKQVTIEMKEIKLSPRTDTHDIEVKVKHILRFLEEGNKAKVNVVFKGRELARPALGLEIFEQIKQMLEESALIESEPKMEGKVMSMVLAPKAKKKV